MNDLYQVEIPCAPFAMVVEASLFEQEAYKEMYFKIFQALKDNVNLRTQNSEWNWVGTVLVCSKPEMVVITAHKTLDRVGFMVCWSEGVDGKCAYVLTHDMMNEFIGFLSVNEDYHHDI